MKWTDEKRKQLNCLLNTVPNEDVAVMTATIWCKEFNLKFTDIDENIIRRYHRYFHHGSLEVSTGKLYLYVKNAHNVWIPIKTMSTNAASIWTCIDRNNSFMKFNNTIECRKMAMSYINAAKKRGIDIKIVEA